MLYISPKLETMQQLCGQDKIIHFFYHQIMN